MGAVYNCGGVETLNDLLPRLRRGEEGAWGILHRELYGKLWSTVFRIVDDAPGAEDVIQEAFVKAIREIGNFDSRSQIGTWVYRIAVNQALDWVRSRQRRSAWITFLSPIKEERDDERMESVPEGEVEPLVSQGLEREELRRVLSEAIGELSVEHRAVVQLRLIDELSLEESAEILGCKVGTVNSRLHYACKYLQKKLRAAREELTR